MGVGVDVIRLAVGRPARMADAGDGRGQRALIVSPPKAGKTFLLKYIAAGITAADDITPTADRPTSNHLAWSHSRQGNYMQTPLVYGEHLYMCTDGGVLSCLNAKTGAQNWRARLKGQYSASPLYADGRIYFQNEDGLYTVIEPGLKFKKLAENQVDGRTFASLAPADGGFFLRTSTHLYRIEEREKR